MGLWLCLGSVESNRFRYGNIGVLVLTLTSASISPLSTAKSITTLALRVVLFRSTGSVTSIGFPPLFQPPSLGYFNVCSDYLKLFRTVVSSIQAKVICGFLYFELISPFNTSIPCCIVFLLLLFILLLSIPPVAVVETL
ncbi:hypothetical protein F2Q68_00022507 [Brassica cretica]|uniref:Uncharacterized protein n=1 Tax=Brassica cretica TaxID=69181 RepID=A0A8S9FQX2_BRACR|nr:hypothetical protein F2Q68_00022507 [Brassica cretica]